jgi:hypothetical protein
MATDMLKVVKGKQGEDVLRTLGAWVRDAPSNAPSLSQQWKKWVTRVEGQDLVQLTVDGRELMNELGAIVAGVLLVVDAETSGDEVAEEIARRWIAGSNGVQNASWQEQHAWNTRIVFGDGKGAEKSKL